jgi:hypothetical protein
MHDHGDFYLFASGFWWLIFPIGWGMAGLVRVMIRHREAQTALGVLKSYADQGKEAPPELVQMLKSPARRQRAPMDRSRGTLMAGLIFTALSVALFVLRMTQAGNNGADNQGGLLFAVVLMAGFAAAFFIASYVFARDARLEKP